MLPGGHSAADGRVERSPSASSDIYTLMKNWTLILVSFFPPPSAVKDDSKRGHYRDKIKGYMDRAEQIKAHVNQMKEGR